MSIQGLNWCIKQKTDTPTTKLVLFILSNYADEVGSCYPSEKKLAELVGVSDRQIRRCLTWLVDNKLITIEHRKGTSNRYFMSMDTDVQPLRTPTSTNTKVNTKNKPSKDFYSKNFKEFWKLYPRKVGKHAAAMSFAKAETLVFFDDLMKYTKMFVAENTNTDERFIPHAATWLNQRRFLDYKDKKNIQRKQSINNLAG